MRVSIIVPLYGVEKYVERCARSLFEQSFKSLEFIFVDDCSPDGSAAIVESLLAEYEQQRSRTTILRNDRNMGVSASRNRALDIATGHFVLFVDGDDWCSPELVEELVIEQMECGSDIVASSYYMVDGDQQQLVSAAPIGGRRGSLRIVAAQSFDLPNRIWGVLMRRSLICDRGITFDERITMGEDYLFLIKALYYSDRIAFTSKGLYYYRQGSGVMSKLGRSKRRSYVRAVASVRSFLKSQPDYHEFNGALRLSRFNLQRWLMLRKSRALTLRSVLFRAWCYALNFAYKIYCQIVK